MRLVFDRLRRAWWVPACVMLGLMVACQPGRIDPAVVTVFPATPTGDVPLAQEALVTFFDELAAGRYNEAVAYYGGSYETLLEWNPDVPAEEHATLWRNGCSVNGLNCLTVRSAVAGGITGSNEYLFTVDFSTREGEQFVLGPCCGVTEEEQPPVSYFQVHVDKGDDGRFRVMDLPPYTP